MIVFDALNGQTVPYSQEPVVCLDFRKFDLSHPKYPGLVWDLELLSPNDYTSLELMVRHYQIDGCQYLSELNRRVRSALKAAKNSGIDVKSTPIELLVDKDLWKSYLNSRSRVMLKLFEGLAQDVCAVDYKEMLEFARALHLVEQAGIYVNADLLNDLYEEGWSPANEAFAKRAVANLNGRYLETQFDPRLKKTGRIGIKKGFNPMSIPYGLARDTVMSRFPYGSICVIDFNAMDFRSLIHLTNDKDLIKLYEGHNDFHARTSQILFGDTSKRDLVKALCYATLYGGSVNTVSQKTRLSIDNVEEVFEKFWKVFKSIKDLGSKYYSDVREFGEIILSTGRKIYLSPEEAAYKILAIAGQSFSSHVFQYALVKAVGVCKDYKSRIVFTVHDEIVIDLHPEEEELPQKICEAIKEPIPGFKYEVKVQKGKTYGEATT